MSTFITLRDEILSYFLTDYPADSGPRLLEDVVKEFLGRTYHEDLVAKFWDDQGQYVQEDILKETNRRIQEGGSLRLSVMDDIGEKIAGCGTQSSVDPRIAFQDALHDLSPQEFETLSAAILRIAGCHLYWITPQSHDQGLDAFGYVAYLFSDKSPKWLGGKPELVFMVQAKHFRKTKISSVEIREFVGSATLAKHEIYAVQGEKYTDLKVRPFSPVALLYITSGEVKITAKIIAQKTGMILMASDELFELFKNHWLAANAQPKPSKKGYLSRLRGELQGIPVAS